ncbi:transposase (plasmid) [Embleya sp. NBC_00888]|uniref:transposase n=1 Tax=Embleya sp. NBC_00888 TaxID=2975960 RepID=UPI002F90E6DC|nr:transposase [Embleya sp. NBC_00888]
MRNRKVGAAAIAVAAADAAGRRHTALPGERDIPRLVYSLAREVIALDEKVDKLIEIRSREHERAEVISGLSGIGPLPCAGIPAATGGALDAFGAPDGLAGFAGLVPGLHDSGRVDGVLCLPHCHHRGPQRVCCASAVFDVRRSDGSRRFHDRRCTEAARHTQAVLVLGRRRFRVLWAWLCDGRCHRLMPLVMAGA